LSAATNGWHSGSRTDSAGLLRTGPVDNGLFVIDAQAFWKGQEHHTLQPVLETVEARFKKLCIADNIY